MRILVLLLLLANLTLLGYTKLDSLGTGEGVRLAQQVQPDRIVLLSPQQVAALGPAKVSALADVCVEWGPLSDADKARALASLEPLDLAKLISQKKVEVVANYWVFIPPAPNRSAADRRVEELKALGVKGAKVGPRAQAVLQNALIVRDPPGPAMTRMKELQTSFVGSEIKVGACERTS